MKIRLFPAIASIIVGYSQVHLLVTDSHTHCAKLLFFPSSKKMIVIYNSKKNYYVHHAVQLYYDSYWFL